MRAGASNILVTAGLIEPANMACRARAGRGADKTRQDRARILDRGAPGPPENRHYAAAGRCRPLQTSLRGVGGSKQQTRRENRSRSPLAKDQGRERQVAAAGAHVAQKAVPCAIDRKIPAIPHNPPFTANAAERSPMTDTRRRREVLWRGSRWGSAERPGRDRAAASPPGSGAEEAIARVEGWRAVACDSAAADKVDQMRMDRASGRAP
jgi:hypothetical protein